MKYPVVEKRFRPASSGSSTSAEAVGTTSAPEPDDDSLMAHCALLDDADAMLVYMLGPFPCVDEQKASNAAFPMILSRAQARTLRCVRLSRLLACQPVHELSQHVVPADSLFPGGVHETLDRQPIDRGLPEGHIRHLRGCLGAR